MEKPTPYASRPQLHLTFYLDDTLYGVPVSGVREIIPMVEVTPVPDAPATVEGVINLRGHIVPVIQLRRKLKLPEKAPDGRTCIVIAEAGGRPFGFLADRVTDCLEIGEVSPPAEEPAKGAPERRFIAGIGQNEGTIIILLELENLFSSSERKAAARTDVPMG